MTDIPEDTDRLLSVRDVAARIGVSHVSVWRFVKRGHLPKPMKIGTRLSRWKASDIEDFLDAAAARHETAA